MNQNQIKAVYDQVAKTYLADRQKSNSQKPLTQLLRQLDPQSSILDVGCGAGVPIASTLIKHGHSVTGIDISSTQIMMARRLCPCGDFVVADLKTLTPKQFSVDALVCYYTLFHLPRVEHSKILELFGTFIKPEGLMLITMGDREFEGSYEFFNQTMWASQYGPKMNRALITKAGFRIIWEQMVDTNNEHHQVILARRMGR